MYTGDVCHRRWGFQTAELGVNSNILCCILSRLEIVWDNPEVWTRWRRSSSDKMRLKPPTQPPPSPQHDCRDNDLHPHLDGSLRSFWSLSKRRHSETVWSFRYLRNSLENVSVFNNAAFSWRWNQGWKLKARRFVVPWLQMQGDWNNAINK